MNGAQALIRTLVDSGVDICFGNPGTSEMHFVAALDDVPEMRGVLGLQETVVTGAADGYARMAGRPAATLLHLGPGLANGMANLHNARRAHTPVVNVIGDHATYHAKFDAPLQSDIEAMAGTLKGWVRSSTETADVARDGADAVAAARATPGRVANLILPADVSWGDGGEPAAAVEPTPATEVSDAAIDEVAAAITSGEGVMILLGGSALREPALMAAGAIAAATGAQLVAETFPARIERGAGLPVVPRLGYLAEQVEAQLAGIKHIVLASAKAPVSFFAYPGRPGDLVPEDCSVHTLAGLGDDVTSALQRLAEKVAPGAEPELQQPWLPEMPSGELNAHAMAETIACTLPENVIIADESNTSGVSLPFTTAGAPRHDVLTLTGGAIGQGMPVATGAALACPDRPVLNLEADGSAMYSLSALWTQAREQLNVTTVIFNNSAYAILRMELERVGAEPSGDKAGELLDLSRPHIDFVPIAQGMGVPATRATTCEELAEQLRAAYAEPGPHLIDAVLAPLF
ncbi:MAG: acetolactate synthase large subunit [Actinobacteria bacterium]|nr:acetolactate synthase large subunit [Actinomycetota bacterium]